MNLLKRIPVIFFLLILTVIGSAQSYNGIIIRVIDGDTYVFQTEEGSFIVRMYGIDAPERNQPFSEESTKFLSTYLYKEAITKVNGTDRYGRRIGTLYFADQDINMLSIKNGFSWHYKHYSKDKEYADAEEYASRKKIGLWELDNPVPPCEWRQNKSNHTR